MELEEMKLLWDSMSEELEKQKKLTDKLIIEMTQQKYKNSLQRISIPETIGAIICYTFAIIILMNFEKYDHWFLILCAVLSLIILLFLPIFSLRAVSKMKRINIIKNSYKKTISQYTTGKKEFLLVGKFGIYVGIPMIFLNAIIFAKIMGKDIELPENPNAREIILKLILPFSVAILYFVIFTRLVMRKYKKAFVQAEELLQELN